MKLFKKIAIALLIISMPSLVFAQGGLENIPDYMTVAPSGDTFNVMEIVNTVINWLFYALLVLALVYILLIAISYVTQGGSAGADKVKDNGKKLGFILLGIAVALLAKGLIYLTCLIVGDSTACTFKW